MQTSGEVNITTNKKEARQMKVHFDGMFDDVEPKTNK